jgi:phage baseplate assembly protein W
MDEGQIFGRGIGFPPRLSADGRWAWSVGAQNIRESIQIILQTELGERLFLPGFGGGLQKFLFEPNTVSTHRLIQDQILQALGRWEPRINVESVNVLADPSNRQAAIVTIAYKLVATGVRDQLGLTVRLAG